jgi:hypothetical protein
MVSINQVAPPGALHCKPAAEYSKSCEPRLKIYSKTVAIQEKQSQTAYFNNRTNRAYKA